MDLSYRTLLTSNYDIILLTKTWLKYGDINEIKNDRSISKLSMFAKVFEGIIIII